MKLFFEQRGSVAISNDFPYPVEYIVSGNSIPKLSTACIPGAKNLAMPIIAFILAAGIKCKLINVPNIQDILTLLECGRKFGANITSRAVDEICIDASNFENIEIEPEISGSFRGSVYLTAVVAVRGGYGLIAPIGGDVITGRTLQNHVRALNAFGFSSILECSGIRINEIPNVLEGKKFKSKDRGVTASCIALTLAALSRGKSKLTRMSREHEVMDFVHFLRAVGVRVYVSGRTYTVVGVPVPREVCYEIPSDVTVFGTYAIIHALKSLTVPIRFTGPARRLEIAIAPLRCAGVKFHKQNTNEITVSGRLRKNISIETGYPPFLPADLQPIYCVLCLSLPGVSKIVDKVYLQRYDHLEYLASMGAKFWRNGRTLYLAKSSLAGVQSVGSLGIRETAALMIAAICADGDTSFSEIKTVHRGYENLVDELGYRIQHDI